MKIEKVFFDQGQVILTDGDGHAYSFKATRLKEIAYAAISCVPSSQKELWDSHFLDFYRSQEFFNSGYTIKEFSNDFIITRTIPPLRIWELDEDPRYRVGGDIPADAINNSRSRDAILDDINDLVQKIEKNNKEILEIISKSQK